MCVVAKVGICGNMSEEGEKGWMDFHVHGVRV